MNWSHEINIRPILNDEEISLAKKAELMKAALMVTPFTDTIPQKNILIFITGILDQAGEQDDVELFDDGLEYLYDWADMNKVWLGI